MLDRVENSFIVAPNVQEWIDLARWAPSGGNAQPWKVQWRSANGKIEIFLKICQDYQKNPSSMDLEGKASALSLGCLAKNLEIIAEKDGYKLTATQLFEGQLIWDCSAKLEFVQKTSIRTNLLSAVVDRKTDRNLFKKGELPFSFTSELQLIKKKYSAIKVKEFMDNRTELIPSLIKIEKLRWSNDYLINGMIKEICFDKKTFSQGLGIPVWQLGIGAFDQILMKVLHRWLPLRKFFKLGLAGIPANKSVRLPILHSNRIVFLECKENNFASWYSLGNMFQEIWIQASAAGISFQPLSQSLIVEGYWANPEYSILNEKEKSIVKQVTESLSLKFDLNFKNPSIGFRLGLTVKEEGRSSRKKITALNLQRD